MTKKILVVHGPNLNLLGEREPEIYGKNTLNDINNSIREYLQNQDISCSFFQSNHEGEIIDEIQRYRNDISGLIINPGAYTHTSIAIMDTLISLKCPKIEVHLSNIHAREKFRSHSYISFAATGIICGLGSHGYLLAAEYLAGIIKSS